MMGLPHIKTGGTAFNRTLARVGLAAAVLLATVIVGAGSAVAAPVGAAPATDAPNETAAGPQTVVVSGTSFAASPGERVAEGGAEFAGGGAPDFTRQGDGLQMEVVEVTEERIVVEVQYPNGNTFDEREIPTIYLGHADQFEVSEDGDAVSPPEDTDGLAAPVSNNFLGSEENMHGKLMYFRTEDLDLSEEDEELTLGLGVFPDGERTVSGEYFDTYSTGQPMIQ